MPEGSATVTAGAPLKPGDALSTPSAPRRVRGSRTLFAYIARGMGVNSLVAFIILEAVFGIIFTVRATEGISSDILIIFPILLMAFAQATTYTLPVALLFGTSLLMGRLNADREVSALRSFGVSPAQMLVPVAAFGVLAGSLAFYINMDWVPETRFAVRRAAEYFLERLGYLGEGWGFEYKGSEATLWVEHYDGPVLQNILITSGKARGGLLGFGETLRAVDARSYTTWIIARRGRVGQGTGENAGKPVVILEGVDVFFDNDLTWALFERKQDMGPSPPPRRLPGASSDFLQRLSFERFEFPLEALLGEKNRTVKDMPRWMLAEDTARRLAALKEAERKKDTAPLGTDEAERRRAEVEVEAWRREYCYAATEFHRRLALSFCSILFPLCAFLIGLNLASANRLLPFFLSSTAVPLLFFAPEMLGNFLARNGVAPWVTEEFGLLALGMLGLWLLFRIQRAPRK